METGTCRESKSTRPSGRRECAPRKATRRSSTGHIGNTQHNRPSDATPKKSHQVYRHATSSATPAEEAHGWAPHLGQRLVSACTVASQFNAVIKKLKKKWVAFK
eukprot:GHVT01096911.1.p2 GENE.GHVT01096911.1~~GHVT01096911.1.p2  ORF type:complete len:104 (+),score=7.50 GHVT01096911.1:245-556(+)